MSEYAVWFDTKRKTSTSIVEIRKAIMKQSKFVGYNIFYGSQVVARMYFAGGNWIYKDFRKGMTYTVKKDGYLSEGHYGY